jgi:transcriptional regulator with XRE-family HTH domain
MSINSNPAFGPRLRAHRERRGITLAALAESMKVKQSLLEGLERNDVSGWPPGIYGRAVVREYAKSIGLSANETLEEFCDLFPEGEDRRRLARSRHDFPVDESDTQLRLTFASASPQTSRVIYLRLISAVIELAVVLTTGYVVALLGDLTLWTANALVGLTWYPISTMFSRQQMLSRILRLRSFPKIVVTNVADSEAGAVIVDHDVHAAAAGSASIH